MTTILSSIIVAAIIGYAISRLRIKCRPEVTEVILSEFVYYDPIFDEIVILHVKLVNPLEMIYLGEL